MLTLDVAGAFVRAPLRFTKLVKCLRLMQKKQTEKIDRKESNFFHPEYICHVGGTSRISGIYRGWGSYRDSIIMKEVATPGSLSKIKVQGDTITLFTRLTGARSNKKLNLDVEFRFKFKDGKIVEQTSIPTDDEKWRDFWA